MSFRWKGLLGVGSISNSSSGPTSPNAQLQDGKENWLIPDEQEWANHSFDPLDVPNMLGFENFGNTCYVNSVMQALYFCDPFRESILAYSAKQLPNKTALKSGPENENARNEIDTLFLALRSLFQRMASAQVTIPIAQANQQSQAESQTQSSSTPSHSTSFIGSGLSRKVSSRPGTASGGKAGVNVAINASNNTNSTNNASTTNSTNTVNGLSSPNVLQTNANSCSNIVVSDTDIKAFLTSLRKNNILFDSTAHQDAHELLNFVLNRIGEDIVDEAKVDGRMNGPFERPHNIVHDVEPNGKTMIHRLFEGILTNETRCLTCESVTSRDECFLDLSLDIERNTSVTACLRQFSASEMLCARNKFFCDTCSGLQEAEKRMKIKKLPNVLALHLKRFKYEESVQRFVKLAYRVVFPMELRLFNTSDDAEDPDKLYELYGIIVHIGVGPHHGHYVAIIKVDKRWFVFDDETISVIDESDISRYFGDTPGAGSAYVLFYQAVDLDMSSLGLPDVKAIRAEKARLRGEESVKRRVELHKQQTELSLSDNLSTPMQRGSSGTATASSLFAGFLGSSSNQIATDGTNDGVPSDVPSRSTTPAEGRSGLFGRFQSPSSVAANSNAPTPINGTTLQIPSTANQAPASPTSPEPSSESKGSWLTSLRSRKGSAIVATNQIFPQTSPTFSSNKVLHAEPLAVDDDGQNSISATSSNHADERNSREERRTLSTKKAIERQRSPLRSDFAQEEKRDEMHKSKGERRATLTGGSLNASTSVNVSPNKSPVRPAAPGQGATFTPAERPLSKKEQEKIARKARRNTSISVSTAHTPATSLPPSPPQSNRLPLPIVATALGNTSPNQGRKSDEDLTPLPTSNSTMSGWRRVTTPRRPTTADPASSDQSKSAQRRRSTLSRTFGFGKKDKNSDSVS